MFLERIDQKGVGGGGVVIYVKECFEAFPCYFEADRLRANSSCCLAIDSQRHVNLL